MFAGAKTDKISDTRILEAAEASAGNAFACAFSTADEYDAALITERRAAGRYDPPRNWSSNWSTWALAACVVVLSVAWLYLS